MAESTKAGPFAHLPYDLADATDFVRELVLPGGPHITPEIAPQYAHYLLKIRESPIHGFGVFACEPIPARQCVIEYTGERISRREAIRRRVRPQLYLFWISSEWLIDGAVGGSGAEFANHSCSPNLVAQVIDRRIFLTSTREIEPGEELLFDYKVRGQTHRMPCRCGSSGCRGDIRDVTFIDV